MLLRECFPYLDSVHPCRQAPSPSSSSFHPQATSVSASPCVPPERWSGHVRRAFCGINCFSFIVSAASCTGNECGQGRRMTSTAVMSRRGECFICTSPYHSPLSTFRLPSKKYEIYHVARTMKTFYKLKRISVERRRMKNMIQQMVQRRMPERQDGPGSVCVAC